MLIETCLALLESRGLLVEILARHHHVLVRAHTKRLCLKWVEVIRLTVMIWLTVKTWVAKVGV